MKILRQRAVGVLYDHIVSLIFVLLTRATAARILFQVHNNAIPGCVDGGTFRHIEIHRETMRSGVRKVAVAALSDRKGFTNRKR